MAEMKAEEEEKTEEKAESTDAYFAAEKSETCPLELSVTENHAVMAMLDVPYEPVLDIEIDFPRAAEELDTENEFLLPLVFGEEYEEQPRPRSKKKTKRKHPWTDQYLKKRSLPSTKNENCTIHA
ncbi:zinc finger MYM-type protein 2-like [Rhinatrema bivittatum]|uniref:zinc finger MYM-type protein 2-like n=1 Tax=Rhinatrema bivittatum TaxID=194408 RepID=UPI0011268CBD|nr:zinc finger MYM-type protein 2-like [Rhinatrema bivittatum]